MTDPQHAVTVLKSVKSDDDLVAANHVQQKQIRISYVQGVKDSDFPQAKRTWEALEKAGLEPGSLVAWGLEEGHDYRIQTMTVEERIKELGEVLGESLISEEVLVGYHFREVLQRDPQTNLLEAGPGLVLYSQALTLAEEQTGLIPYENTTEKAIEMTAIIRRKPLLLGKTRDINLLTPPTHLQKIKKII
jgi:hypothetical protein